MGFKTVTTMESEETALYGVVYVVYNATVRGKCR